MKPTDAIAIKDLENLARRRLPRMLFGVIESGVEDERGLLRNAAAFSKYQFLPRYLVDVTVREQRTKLLDRTYASSFGIAPTGIAGIFRRGAELMLAEAAQTAGVPFVLAGASMVSIEKIAAVAKDVAWYQLYAARDPHISNDLIRRARDAGITNLVITVDNPVYPKRERDVRAGFKLPIHLTAGTVVDALTHPAWLADYLTHGGLPYMESWVPYAPTGSSAAAVAGFVRGQSNNADHTWREMETFRAIWPGKLMVKGILHPADAVRAADCGADGVIISNHGGKTLDSAPATLDVLPFVKAALGERVAIMIDSGIRRGSDIVVARALGADFAFVGRPTLYGAVAGGVAGALRAIRILQEEIDSTLALIGRPNVNNVGREALFSTNGHHG